MVEQEGHGSVTLTRAEWDRLSVTGKVFTVIKLRPCYNKSLKDKLNNLDDTLQALDAHVSAI